MGKQVSEADHLVETHITLAKALAEMFKPVLETVVHDYRKPKASVVAIFNSELTGRKTGGPLTELGEQRLRGEDVPDVLVAYRNEAPDGRVLKSASISFRDSKGELVGALCMNMDTAYFAQISQFFEQFTRTNTSDLFKGSEFKATRSPQEQIQEEINKVLIENNWQGASLSSSQKKEVVEKLYEAGAFNIRGSVASVARELKVTRPSIYKYLPQKPA